MPLLIPYPVWPLCYVIAIVLSCHYLVCNYHFLALLFGHYMFLSFTLPFLVPFPRVLFLAFSWLHHIHCDLWLFPRPLLLFVLYNHYFLLVFFGHYMLLSFKSSIRSSHLFFLLTIPFNFFLCLLLSFLVQDHSFFLLSFLLYLFLPHESPSYHPLVLSPFLSSLTHPISLISSCKQGVKETWCPLSPSKTHFVHLAARQLLPNTHPLFFILRQHTFASFNSKLP